ncbi:MAG TPA: CBS domain-containing protein [Sandaracinaceae bacterium LLY-WYZ-13_1]|nr:CBS domain-containing protein [Sandaracinaceae bacterium LLY-WYZ-13_1]
MSEKRTVRDVMSADVKTIERNEVLSLAQDLMRMERVRHLVVVDEDYPGEVAGVLSQRDLFLGGLARALGYGSVGAQKVLETVPVKDVMSTEVETIGPDAPLREAARRMRDRQIGCLPVVEGDRLVGILTEGDFVRLAAK